MERYVRLLELRYPLKGEEATYSDFLQTIPMEEDSSIAQDCELWGSYFLEWSPWNKILNGKCE